MAKIQEVAGVITSTLFVPPMAVQAHVEGLRAAQRIGGTAVGPAEAADLLSACLSTDAANPCAPFHLPFVGASSGVDGFEIIQAGSPDFNLIEQFAPTFGAGIESAISGIAQGDVAADSFLGLHVTGSGSRLRATVTMAGEIAGKQTTVNAWFGNQPIMDLLRMIAARPPYLEMGNQVGGQVLGALADVMCGLPYSLPMNAAPFHSEAVN